MINPIYQEIKEKNGYKIKSKDLKETVNKLLKVKEIIEISKLPVQEKGIYSSRVYRVLKCNNFNLLKANEQTAKKLVKDVCFCLEEIVVSLEKKKK